MFEGIVIALLLMASLFLVQLTPGPPSHNPLAQRMSVDLDDLLANFDASPDPQGALRSALDRMVADALHGNATLLAQRVSRGLPPGAQVNALLDNGEGRLRLKWEREPAGETASASQQWQPDWRSVLALPAVRMLDPARSSLEVQALPLHRALGLQGQAGVRAEVQLELPGGQLTNLTAFAPLLNRSAGGPVASLSLLDSAGAATSIVRPASGNDSVYLAARQHAGGAVPAGKPLEVRLPPGIADVAWPPADMNPGWTAFARRGNATHGWTATASLASELTGTRQLLLNLTRPGWGALHRVEARLDNGTLGQLQGLLTNSSVSSSTSFLPTGRGPFLSIPGLVPHQGLADGALAIAYLDDGDHSARTLTVQRVTLRAQGGAGLLDAAGSAPASGWVRTGDVLEWTGSRTLARDDALEFRFQLKAHAPATTPADPEALGLDLRNGHTPGSWRLSDAGVFSARIGPRNATVQGYVSDVGDWTADANLTHQGTLLLGTLAYEATDLDLVQGSASDVGRGRDEGWLAVDTANAPLGGGVTVRWDVRRVAEELGLLASQSFKCYTSTSGASAWVADRAACDARGDELAWQFRKQAPNVTLRAHHPSPSDKAWPLESQQVGLPLDGSLELRVNATSLLGTHAVELRAEMPMDGPGGQERTQRVSLLGSFEVRRAGMAEPLAPLYHVVLQAWLPDWG